MKNGDMRVQSQEAANKAQQNEANEFLRKAYVILYGITLFYCIFEAIQNTEQPRDTLVKSIVIIASWGFSYLIYQREHGAYLVKYVDLICYEAVCIIMLLLGGNSSMCFFSLPILIFSLLYFDRTFFKIGCASVLILQLLYLGYQIYLNGGSLNGDRADAATEIFLCIIIIIAIYMNSIQANKFNEIAGIVIGEKMAEIGRLIDEVFQVTKAVEDGAVKASDIMQVLQQSSNNVAIAIKEISDGIQDTTDSIQQQTAMTQTMQREIENTVGITNQVVDYARESEASVNNGLHLVNELASQSDVITKMNSNVVHSMDSLKAKVSEVQNIIVIILNISSQINLLSLNASIESARAGDAGRGFAVVATQIRELANQTKGGAESISDIIAKLNHNAFEAAEAVMSNVKAADNQKKLINSAESDFNNIHDQIKKLKQSIDEISSSVTQLVGSNNEIVECISMISATDEEISASSVEVAKLSQNNMVNASDVKRIIDELVEVARQMEKYKR